MALVHKFTHFSPTPPPLPPAESTSMQLGELGAVEKVIGVMSRFPEQRELLQTACTALASLAVLDTNQDRINACNGPLVLLSVLRANESYPDLQTEALRTIAKASWSSGWRGDWGGG